MVKKPSNVKQLSLNHLWKIELTTKYAYTLESSAFRNGVGKSSILDFCYCHAI